jgi:molybdopterin/thiamine biosynthesis adenylyltransferase
MSLNLENFKLLVVGAGGIGCELLKNLVLTGFSQIEVVSNFFIVFFL